MSSNGNGNGNGHGHHGGFADRGRRGRASLAVLFAKPGPRLGSTLAREAKALQRDWDADERDRAAERRDELAKQDAERIRGAADRAAAARDRTQALRDRVAAALDRAQSAHDRDAAARELALAALDELTWGTNSGPDLDDIEREIERSTRTHAPLTLAYLSVWHLDERLFDEVAAVLRTELRAYDLVVRAGGDEFLCVLPGASTSVARARFAGSVERLQERWGGALFGVGFAQHELDESCEALIARAGANLLANRMGHGAGR